MVGPTSKLLAGCSHWPGDDAGGASALQGRRTHVPWYEAAHCVPVSHRAPCCTAHKAAVGSCALGHFSSIARGEPRIARQASLAGRACVVPVGCGTGCRVLSAHHIPSSSTETARTPLGCMACVPHYGVCAVQGCSPGNDTLCQRRWATRPGGVGHECRLGWMRRQAGTVRQEAMHHAALVRHGDGAQWVAGTSSRTAWFLSSHEGCQMPGDDGHGAGGLRGCDMLFRARARWSHMMTDGNTLMTRHSSGNQAAVGRCDEHVMKMGEGGPHYLRPGEQS